MKVDRSRYVYFTNELMSKHRIFLFSDFMYEFSCLFVCSIVRLIAKKMPNNASNFQFFVFNEGTLKYFKEYTQRNCELECLTDHTLKKCGCVKFSMPSKTHKNNQMF